MKKIKAHFLALSVFERLTALAIVALAATGLVLIAEGLTIKARAAVGTVLLDRAFERALETGDAERPWPWADTRALARVSVPRLGTSRVILEDVSGEALAWGAGHVGGTPLPGDAGTSVLAAHRDTHFAFLGSLEAGDRVEVLRADGRLAVFIVEGRRIARFDAPDIDVHSDTPRLVLSTCWPLDATVSGPLRLIIEAHAAEADANGPPALTDDPHDILAGAQPQRI
ncbi:MAG: class GN sortase [Hyphomicrobiaceae bacterium]|nr:class GN sortase [Hyphomicrobiaceae bacterium]